MREHGSVKTHIPAYFMQRRFLPRAALITISKAFVSFMIKNIIRQGKGTENSALTFTLSFSNDFS